LVRQWRASGLSASEFARRRKLSAKSLSWWNWKLRGQTGHVEFVELELAGATRGTERIEIALDNGRTVRVPDEFDAEALVRVLAVAERS
jgi:hypothetical protein